MTVATRAVRIALACAGVIWASRVSADVKPVQPAAQPAVKWQQRGIALGLFAEERDFDYGPMLAEIARAGASHVSVVIPYYQQDVHAVSIGPHPRFSPSHATVVRTLTQARRLGLQLFLFPILRLTHQASEKEWRGAIVPRDRRAWWASYSRFMLRFARLARAHGAVALCIGSELDSMVGDPQPWRPLVARVRGVFKGQLVYSANWFEMERTAIWSLVDLAGINGYFWLVGKQESHPSVHRLVHGWREARVRIARWWAGVRKPLIITEVGYRSAAGTAANPWAETTRQPVRPAAQVHALEAFFRMWADVDFVRGAYLWNWFGWGGPRSREFTPRGKPAAALICRWYGTAPSGCPDAFGMPWSPHTVKR